MEHGPIFIALGGLFLAGLAADTLGRRTRVPRVTLLLLMGVLAGPAALGLIPEVAVDWYEPLSIVALTMVSFLLGLGALGVSAAMALLIGAVATATDPAAMQETLSEAGAQDGFADTLRGIVAIDDAWGMIAFALAMVAAQALQNGGFDAGHMVLALWEVGGALALGLALGLPAAVLTGRLKPGEPTRLEALGLVFLTAGLALWLEVSFLLAGMTVGAVIANRARHHERAFHEIELIERPFLILFFLLAGASMDVRALVAVGWIGAAYVVLRILGRLAGGWLGGWMGGLSAVERRWIGPALLPQAGVAVGMALVTSVEMPELGATLLTLTIGTTVVFELIGPVVTLLALRKVQQAETSTGQG